MRSKISDSTVREFLRRLHLERIDFLRADVSGNQYRIIRSQAKPLTDGQGRPADDAADISGGLNLVIAHPEPGDAITLAWLPGGLKVEVLSVMRPHRITHRTVTRFRPLLRGRIEKH
jgi:hypothetical protein